MAGVAEDPVDAADGGDGVGVTDTLGKELVADLPREEGRVLRLDPENSFHD